ncbi:hypothetical protein [Bacillus thermotolerans]|uniref:Phage tail length tape-measure protein n=1 Tax=Bacillus thermotolerans TaxID=1221996 RepID=A0A0F5HN22_BACTR|nr:hypothetical protein [Bacillus thermotolerans]KKB34648.1 Phage tail length tape-measure protein [Bacillus thermotolerans]KKB38578.1 Phage tail length tape-measure protein [Bacillus thermotolerans]
MQENFQAKIGADVRDFMSKMKQVDQEIKNTATEATKPINADLRSFLAKMVQVETLSDMIEQPVEKEVQAEVAEFHRKLAEAQAKANALAREQVQVQVSAITADFDTKMAQMKAEIASLRRQLVNVRVQTQYESFGYEAETAKYQRFYRGTSEEARRMSQEIRNAFAQQREAMRGVRDDLIKAEYGYFKLAQSAKDYTGTSQQFMAQVAAMGAAHKKATDNMIKNNELMKISLIQTAGTMLNMSTQASKISDNYARMQNPLLMVNAAGLKAADGLNKLANAGNASVLALKQLGPTANMKELNDMTRMISQGMMRFQAVAMGAAVTSYFFYGALHQAAMGNQEYADSFNTMLATVRQALQPMVDVFTMVMTKVYDFITAIAQMIIKFNEAHPTLAKLIQGVIMLVPALTLLLSPLAVGIGLFAGFQAALASVWPLIAPLVTGLAAMSATVWVTAAAIAGLTAGLVYLWNTNEGFRAAVIAAWGTIKAKAIEVFQGLVTIITPAFEAVSVFVQQKLAQMKTFWDQHGTQVIQAVQNAWNMITTVIQTAMAVLGPIIQVGWQVIVMIIQSAWEAIKNIINGAINVIQGIIKVFAGMFTADFQLMWEGVKQIFQGALQVIWGWINLYFIGKFLGPLKGFVTQAKSLLQAAWNGIKNIFTKTLDAIKSFITSAFNAIKSTIDKAMNAVKSVIQNIWNGIKSFISNVLNSIKSTMTSIWNAIKSLITSVLNGIKSTVSSVWNAIKANITSVMNAIKAAIQAAWNAIKSAITSALNAIKSTVTSIFNAIKSTITSVMNAAKSAIQSAWNAIKSAVTSAVNAIKSTVTSAFNSLKSTVTSAMNNVVSAVKSGWNKAVSFLKSINLASIGRNIIQGLVNGIKSMAGAVSSAISSIASNIKSRIKGALGIHSPSRWMRDEIGKNIVSGVVVGIDRMSRSATQSATNLASSIMDAFTPQLALNDVRMASDPLNVDTQMAELKRQVQEELDVDLWIHQQHGVAEDGIEEGAGRDIVIQIDGQELARVQQPHLDRLNGAKLKLAQYRKGRKG